MKTVILCELLLVLVLCSCATPPVPQELPLATAAQSRAIDAIEEGRDVVVRAYDAELRRVFSELLNERAQRLILAATTVNADGEGTVPVARMQEIIAGRDAAMARIASELDAKRDQFLDDANLRTLRQLNEAVTRWIDVYAIDFGLGVQKLTGEVLDLVGVEPPKITLEGVGK